MLCRARIPDTKYQICILASLIQKQIRHVLPLQLDKIWYMVFFNTRRDNWLKIVLYGGFSPNIPACLAVTAHTMVYLW